MILCSLIQIKLQKKKAISKKNKKFVIFELGILHLRFFSLRFFF